VAARAGVEPTTLR